MFSFNFELLVTSCKCCLLGQSKCETIRMKYLYILFCYNAKQDLNYKSSHEKLKCFFYLQYMYDVLDIIFQVQPENYNIQFGRQNTGGGGAVNSSPPTPHLNYPPSLHVGWTYYITWILRIFSFLATVCDYSECNVCTGVFVWAIKTRQELR